MALIDFFDNLSSYFVFFPLLCRDTLCYMLSCIIYRAFCVAKRIVVCYNRIENRVYIPIEGYYISFSYFVHGIGKEQKRKHGS